MSPLSEAPQCCSSWDRVLASRSVTLCTYATLAAGNSRPPDAVRAVYAFDPLIRPGSAVYPVKRVQPGARTARTATRTIEIQDDRKQPARRAPDRGRPNHPAGRLAPVPEPVQEEGRGMT